MLLCDDEPSPISSDEVFFICEKQTSIDRDDVKDENSHDNDRESETKSDRDDDERQKKTTTNRLNRIIGNKKSIDSVSSSGGDGTIVKENEETEANTERVREAGSQTSHTILVKIQVENCSQCPDKSISLFSHETPSINKENTCKMKKKTVAVQVNFNSIESVVESHCVKISKLRRCNKASLLQNSVKSKKSSADGNSEKTRDNKSSADSTKIYLWSGKSKKKQQQQQQPPPPPLLKSQSVIEKQKSTSNQRFTIHEPLQKSNSLVEKTTIKCKKPPIGCSPLKKLNRSSLTIEPDKITINLSKYSPCASRLAASSKILSSNSPLSPESPLHGVKSRSPRHRDGQINGDSDPVRQMEKATLQASLSLNIQQYQKSHPAAPRSRSVGDSCVTSPTSEATTLSYSPTGTEILSLEEVGPQITVNEVNVDDSIMVLQTREIRDKLNEDYVACSRKANLETKC